MKLLVIPDVHSRKFWRQSIADNIGKVDKIIFLGDYLDPYGEEIQMASELMECKYFGDWEGNLNMLYDIISLKKNEPEKYILLCGNHTMSYISSKFEAASRTDYKNWEKYHKFFSENLNLFNLVYTENDCIFSHAGIVQGWAETVWSSLIHKSEEEMFSIMEIAKFLETVSLKDIKVIKLLSHISYRRGGDYSYGSCEWADIHEHIDMSKTTLGHIEPKGEDGIFQIFGHTQLVNRPIVTDKWVCLDCRKGFIFDTETHSIEDGSNNSL